MHSRSMGVVVVSTLVVLYGCEPCEDVDVVDEQGLCYVQVLEVADSTNAGEDIVARITGVVGPDTCYHLERIERENVGGTWVLRPIAHHLVSGRGCCPEGDVHFDESVNLGSADPGWVFVRTESDGPVLVESTFVRLSPGPPGSFTYTGYVRGEPAVVGWLTLSQYSPGSIRGEWHFTCARDSCSEAGPQIGDGPLSGWILEGVIYVALGPWRDNNVTLMGQLAGDRYTGYWKWVGFSGRIIQQGQFEAVKK